MSDDFDKTPKKEAELEEDSMIGKSIELRNQIAELQSRCEGYDNALRSLSDTFDSGGVYSSEDQIAMMTEFAKEERTRLADSDEVKG